MASTKRPNFLVIVADDLGFSDTAPFGSEIHTPNLTKLADPAEGGIRLTNFHTASACSPTRSMLLSGTDNHIAGLGQMAEVAKTKHFENRPGYEGYLNFKVAALSEILQDEGYLTMMSGKWHLGGAPEQTPTSRGFEKGFVYLPGSGNHYNFEPQLNARRRPSFAAGDPNKFWMKNGSYLDRKKDLPEDFYSTKSFTDEFLGYLENRTAAEKEKPFFGYLAYTAPHWPLQAPREVIDLYRGKYDDGPDGLKARRLRRMEELGIIPPGTTPAPMSGMLDPEWASLPAEQRAASARKMEVFAAMVHVMDEQIGRVTDHLRATGELDNTFVVFMSDNGAEGALLEALPIMGGASSMGALIENNYDNSLENIGNRDSFVWYGANWACASMAPSRGFKTWITEGGIRCPCIVRYPPLQQKGSITNAFATVMDILPTFLQLAGVTHPSEKKGALPYRGRSDVARPRGKSWVSHLSGASPEVHDAQTAVHGWELFGLRAIREGPWKAVYMTAPRGKDAWELYDVEKDPAEMVDLSEREPAVLARLVDHWDTYFSETGMFDPGIEYKSVADKLIEDTVFKKKRESARI